MASKGKQEGECHEIDRNSSNVEPRQRLVSVTLFLMGKFWSINLTVLMFHLVLLTPNIISRRANVNG